MWEIAKRLDLTVLYLGLILIWEKWSIHRFSGTNSREVEMLRKRCTRIPDSTTQLKYSWRIIKPLKPITTSSLYGTSIYSRDNLKERIDVTGHFQAPSQLFQRLGDGIADLLEANTDLVQWALMSFMGSVNYSFKRQIIFANSDSRSDA